MLAQAGPFVPESQFNLLKMGLLGGPGYTGPVCLLSLWWAQVGKKAQPYKSQTLDGACVRGGGGRSLGWTCSEETYYAGIRRPWPAQEFSSTAQSPVVASVARTLRGHPMIKQVGHSSQLLSSLFGQT